MRWSEADYQEYIRRGQPPALTERAWQGAVMRLLTQHGYMTYHTFDSRRSPSGFPDIIAVHARPGRDLLAVELKTDTGHLTLAQAAWLEALQGTTGLHTGVWRPQELDDIVAQLSRESWRCVQGKRARS